MPLAVTASARCHSARRVTQAGTASGRLAEAEPASEHWHHDASVTQPEASSLSILLVHRVPVTNLNLKARIKNTSTTNEQQSRANRV
jgi:hypothetical protein